MSKLVAVVTRRVRVSVKHAPNVTAPSVGMDIIREAIAEVVAG
jgi:hypothetical protein